MERERQRETGPIVCSSAGCGAVYTREDHDAGRSSGWRFYGRTDCPHLRWYSCPRCTVELNIDGCNGQPVPEHLVIRSR